MQPSENFITTEADALSGAETSDEIEPRFTRTFFVIFAAHVALISLLPFFDKAAKPPVKPAEQITWMDADALIAAASVPLPEPAVDPEPIAELPLEPVLPPPTPEPEAEDKLEPVPEPPPVLEPKADPIPEPKQKPEPELATKPKPEPKVAPKPEKPKLEKPKSVTKPFIAQRKPEQKPKKSDPKPKQRTATTDKKPEIKKPDVLQPTQPSPTQTASNTSTRAEGKDPSAQATGGNSTGGNKPGGLTQSELSSYFRSVGERFRTVWNEPVTVIGTGRDLVAYVRIRVKADGTVESATLNGSSGSREMDDSIQAAFPTFKNVPPPPPALLKSNGCMEETMEIKLGL